MSETAPPSFVRTFLLPALWVFVLPVLGVAFATYALDWYDETFVEDVSREISADPELSPDARAEALANWQSVSLVALCGDTDPNTVDLRESLSAACSDIGWYRWISGLGWAGLGLGGMMGLVIGGASAAARRSRDAQLPAFRFGWNALRVLAALQTVAQGALATLMSFWVTAFFFEMYVIKLVAVAGMMAVVAVGMVVAAIFAVPDLVLPVVGRRITPTDAPELWQRVRALASALGTDPPAQIIAGIDDNFFVTEGEVACGEERLKGRTLFVSLSLLRVLSRAEADAVLAHEMAHFSGGDTAHSRELVPMRARYGTYTQALAQGGLTIPVALAMRAFDALFELAVANSSRERELRADRLAAEQVSGRAIATSLLKVSAYARFRARVEETLFGAEQVLAEVRIPERVRSQFSGYAQSPELLRDLIHARVPHPFDSHPPMLERFASVGVDLPPSSYAATVMEDPGETWLEAIPVASTIESALWADYERAFAGAQEQALAWRSMPTTPERRALIERHFPPQIFNRASAGPVEVTIDHISAPEWDAPLTWDQIAGAKVADHLMQEHLTLTLVSDNLIKPVRRIKLRDLGEARDHFLNVYGRYSGRHVHAMAAVRRGPES